MNKIINLSSMFALAIMTIFVACKKELKYSCDEGINTWAANAREFNQDISRDSLVTYEVDSQIAIFNALTSENKYRIYQEKFTILLSSQSYTTAEKAHLQALLDFMEPSFYENPADSNVIDSFYTGWRIYAMNNFSWTDDVTSKMAETWLTETELNAMISGGGGSGGSGGAKCTCRRDWFCGFGNTCNNRNDCTLNGGCGLFGTSNCKGRCSWDK